MANATTIRQTYPGWGNAAVYEVNPGVTSTITLSQNPTFGFTEIVKDVGNLAATFNIIVSGGAYLVDGLASFVINTNGGSATFYFDGVQYTSTATGMGTNGVLPVANGGTNNKYGIAFPSPVAPSPANTEFALWLSSAYADVQATSSAAERYPLGFLGQEPSAWTYNNSYYLMYTTNSAILAVTSCPVSSDITATSIFWGTISGSTLTVSEPDVHYTSDSPDNTRPIQAGMILQSGTGATILPFGTSGTTGVGGAGTYALSASPGNVTTAQALFSNFWSVPVNVVGGGNGGVAGAVAHSYVYIEGNNLYNYFVATSTAGGFTTQNTYVATSTLATALSSWTASSTPVLGTQGTANGNTCVVKSGATYYLFQEYLTTLSNPFEGTTSGWQIGLFSCATATGTFTAVGTNPLQSVRPNPHGGASGMQVFLENGQWVMFFHSNSWSRVMPSEFYRATSPNIATDTWTITNGGAPFMRQAHKNEVDQLGDPFAVRSPSGATYLFYEGADNRTSIFPLMVTQLLPSLKQWDGYNWHVASSGYDCPDRYARDSVQWNWSVNPAIQKPSNTFGAWVPTAVSSSCTGGALVGGAAQNDLIDYDVMLAPGQYALTLTYNAASTGGIVTALMDDGAGGYVYSLNSGTATNVANCSLLLYSNTLSNSNWSALNVSVSAYASPSPSGQNDGWTLTSTATGADRIDQPQSAITAGVPYTISAYMKAGTVNGYLAFVQSGVMSYAMFNLATGVVQSTSGTGATSTITSVGNGWYRCTLTQNAATSSSLHFVAGPQDNSGTNAGYPNNGTASGSVNIYGCQMELNSVAQPLSIPQLDTYAAAPAYNQVGIVTFQIFGAETLRRRIRLKMANKNASSSGYTLSLVGMSLQRTTT